MARSEFSNRLECLTSFSSQLVLICSDKVKQQSQIVDDFVVRQGDDANLALITANELTPLASYRQTLFQQLVGASDSHNYHLPLNQLLASLNQHEGPLLVCIFHAESLPNKLVKELWELVLQSRFAKNKQHLNVLLMGSADWANNTKHALASTSKEKPILLNGSHSSVSSDQFSSSRPTQLVPEQSPEPATKGKLNKVWLLSLVALVFIGVFLGLLSWLYQDELLALIQSSDTTAATEITQSQPAPKKEQLAETIVEVPAPQSSIITALPDPLITDWQSAALALVPPASISQAAEPVTTVNSEPVISELTETLASTTPVTETPVDLPSQLAASDTLENSANLELVATETAVSQQPAVNDYPVADIPIVDVIPDAVPAAETTLSSPSYLYDEATLLALSKSTLLIQRAAMSNYNLLTSFITDNNLSQTWVYQTTRYGSSWYVLLEQVTHDSMTDARASLATIPTTKPATSPFIKTVAQIQQEISLNL